MRTGKELFEIWAPSNSIWSPWVSPVLFADIDCRSDAAPIDATASFPTPHLLNAPSGNAVIIDLPGAEAVRVALDLAARGYRPVPIINASPGPPPTLIGPATSVVTLDMSALVKEVCSATLRLERLTLPADAPPAFILDSQRIKGTNPLKPEKFDNRWMVFPQDFPSARILAEQKITRVTMLQAEKAPPQEDLSHVLLRWQEAGIEIRAGKIGDLDPPIITVSRPSRFKIAWYRALAILGLRCNSVGGFGSFLPQTWSSG